MAIPPEVEEFLKGPACPAPEGQVSNLDNPPTKNQEALFLGILCVVLITTVSVCRVYTRTCIVKKLHIEDYLGIAAIIPFTGLAWCYFNFAIKAGFFVQMWDLPGSILVDLGYTAIAVTISYGLVMIFLKTAILLEWIRIFVPDRTRNIFYWGSVTLILINGGFYIGGIGASFGYCRPLEKTWHFWLPGSCINPKSRDVLSSVFNLVMDVFILLLPQKIIWTLHMSRRQRIGVSVIFSVGLLVIATAVGRLHATVTLDYQDGNVRPLNTTYKFSQTIIWAMSEVTCTFFVFCVPALPKLFADGSVMSRVPTSWRSWIRLPQSSSSKRFDDRLRPSSTRRGTGPQTSTTHPHEGNMSAYSGTELNIVIKPSQYGRDPDPPSPPQIYKTVEFNSQDDAASRRSVDPCIESQHLWMAQNA